MSDNRSHPGTAPTSGSARATGAPRTAPGLPSSPGRSASAPAPLPAGAGLGTERLKRAASRCLGIALAVTTCDPSRHGGGGFAAVLFLLVAAGFAWWAAPPVTGRPVSGPSGRLVRLARHRNTVLATACVVLAALGNPPAWLAAGITALLLGYLVLVDAFGHGHRPAGPLPALAAVAAAGLVLLASLAPTGACDWARPLAVLGVAVAAFGVGVTLWAPRPESPPEQH